MPKISVLMCVYNDEGWLKNSIDSIVNQTFTDFEFVIVNDGSTDNSLEIINSYSDDRIRIINNEENLGLPKSLNRGLKVCKSELIARMDADDISMNNRLEKQYEYLKKNKEIALIGGHVEYIDSDGSKVDFVHKYPISNDLIKWELFRDVPFCHPSVMFRHNILKKIGLYNEGFLYAQDFELWQRMASYKFKFSNLNDKILYYRKISEKQTSSKKKKQNKAHIKILTHYFKSKSFKVNNNITYYYYYGPKKVLNNKKLIINGVNLLLHSYKNFISSNVLSKLNKENIQYDAALKLINFAKVQKQLLFVTRIHILIKSFKIIKKIYIHYQFRKTLRTIIHQQIKSYLT